MNDKESIARLRQEFGYWLAPAQATVDLNGICQYCKDDLLACRRGHSSMAVNHLLPKSVYPELVEDESNWLLTCSSCNGMKGGFDPPEGEEERGALLGIRRTELIEHVHDHLNKTTENRTKE